MSIHYLTWTSDRDDNSSITRELRSGLSGLGGRPVLHPAWRETAEPRARMAPTSLRRAWPGLGLSPTSARDTRLAA